MRQRFPSFNRSLRQCRLYSVHRFFKIYMQTFRWISSRLQNFTRVSVYQKYLFWSEFDIVKCHTGSYQSLQSNQLHKIENFIKIIITIVRSIQSIVLDFYTKEFQNMNVSSIFRFHAMENNVDWCIFYINI
jgi:hypothetical protein